MLNKSLDKEVEHALEALKMKILREKETDIRELLILIRVYAILDNKEAYQTIIRLGEELVSEKGWQSIEENLQKEFYDYQALAYEQLQLWENAIDSYTRLSELVDGENEKEQIFLRLIEIYLKKNETNKVIETCKKGMKELSKSIEIRVRYVESLWLNDNLNDNDRLEEIKNLVSETPELIKEESFIRLLRTKGIHLEDCS